MLKDLFIVYFILFLSIFSFFSFGLFHLTKFETSDEHLWKYGRIATYWQEGILKHDWKKTQVNDKPGISTVLISGIGLLFEPNPLSHIIVQDTDEQKKLYREYDHTRTEYINFVFRFPLLIFNTLSLLFFFWIIKRITHNHWIAALSVMAIAFSPILIGISQIINPDTMLWTFGTAAILSYIALLQNQIPQSKKEHTHNKSFFHKGDILYIFLVGIFTGFGLLSKYTLMILFPFFVLLFISHYFISYNLFQSRTDTAWYFRCVILKSVLTIIISLIIFSIFLPAVFINPKILYEGTIGFSSFTPLAFPLGLFLAFLFFDSTAAESLFMHTIGHFFYKHRQLILKLVAGIALFFFIIVLFNAWFEQKLIPVDTIRDLTYSNRSELKFPREKSLPEYKKNFYGIFSQGTSFIFSVPPLLLLIVLTFWVKIIFRGVKQFHLLVFFLSILPILFFVSAYLSGIILNIRYSILVYPLFSILAVIALWDLFSFSSVESEIKENKSNRLRYFVFTFLFFVTSLFTLLSIAPYYFTYTNFLLPKKFSITDPWGYGVYEAAQFINSQPNPENIIIWTNRQAICQFIMGKCLNDKKGKIDLKTQSPDYLVITYRGTLKNRIKWLDPTYSAKPSEWYYDNLDQNYDFNFTIDERPKSFTKVVKFIK